MTNSKNAHGRIGRENPRTAGVPRSESAGTAESNAQTVLPELLTMEMIRQHYLPLGKRTVFRLISENKFPKADVTIGGKIRLWRRETVQSWVDEQSGA